MSPADYIIAAAGSLGVEGWQTGDVEKKVKIVRELAAWE
jgi:hypothetical protein